MLEGEGPSKPSCYWGGGGWAMESLTFFFNFPISVIVFFLFFFTILESRGGETQQAFVPALPNYIAFLIIFRTPSPQKKLSFNRGRTLFVLPYPFYLTFTNLSFTSPSFPCLSYFLFYFLPTERIISNNYKSNCWFRRVEVSM